MADELRWQTFAGEGNATAQLGDTFVNRSDVKIHVRILNLSGFAEHATVAATLNLQWVKGAAFDGVNNSVQAKITLAFGHGDGAGGSGQKTVAFARGQMTLEPNEQCQVHYVVVAGASDTGTQLVEMGYET